MRHISQSAAGGAATVAVATTPDDRVLILDDVVDETALFDVEAKTKATDSN